MDAFVASTQANVTGAVKLSLYKGNIAITGRTSPTSLYRPDIASFTMGAGYDQKDAEGFIRILGLPARSRAIIHASRRARGVEMKMWSGRFSQPLDPEFESWQRSLPFDKRLLKHEIAASGAHAKALQKAGVLTGEELSLIHGRIGADRARWHAVRRKTRRSKISITSWSRG